MGKRNFFSLILPFALSIILLTAVVFAWMTLSQNASIDDFLSISSDYDTEVDLYVGKNGTKFESIKTKEDVERIFINTVPGDEYFFRLKIKNKSTEKIKVTIKMEDISSSKNEVGYDMRDVFYIKDGKIIINENINNVIVLPVNSEEDSLVNDQILNKYNINNLIQNNVIILVDEYSLQIEAEFFVDFIIVYDENTSSANYRNESLILNSIKVFIK